MNKNEIESKYVGNFAFKGASSLMRLFKIKTQKDKIREERIRIKRRNRKIKRQISSIVKKLILLVIIAGILYYILTNKNFIASLF